MVHRLTDDAIDEMGEELEKAIDEGDLTRAWTLVSDCLENAIKKDGGTGDKRSKVARLTDEHQPQRCRVLPELAQAATSAGEKAVRSAGAEER